MLCADNSHPDQDNEKDGINRSCEQISRNLLEMSGKVREIQLTGIEKKRMSDWERRGEWG